MVTSRTYSIRLTANLRAQIDSEIQGYHLAILRSCDPANLTQLRLNSNPNLLTWLNSDSTHLSQSWVKSDSRLITFYLIWEKVVDRGGGGVVECSCRLVLSL